ncbi:MAG: NAD(+) synthase [Candidatus Lokiarchaeota archaeon]|nr:NAD(+) synthase [Candidatus Lokiarchaeota archaeon]
MITDVKAELERIKKFIKKLVEESGTKGIVIALSGGIDSALVAGLSVVSLSKKSVQGLILPCHSNPNDQEDAILIADHLGIEYKIVELTESYDLFLKTLELSLEADSIQLAKANVKPRMRMIATYYFANQLNYLVAGTGNKSEDDIGYFTKYGDGGVDFLPIQHLYKHEVRQLSRYLKLPEKIITRTPTAGLWEGQTDEDELSKQLGFKIVYDELDEMLDKIEKNEYDKNDVRYQKLVELKRKSLHKVKLPPSLPRNF